MPLLMEAARYRRVAEEWRVRAETTADTMLRHECEVVAQQYEELAALALGLRPPTGNFIAAYGRERNRAMAPAARAKRRSKRSEGNGSAGDGEVRAG